MNIEIKLERARRSTPQRLHDPLVGKLSAGERKHAITRGSSPPTKRQSSRS